MAYIDIEITKKTTDGWYEAIIKRGSSIIHVSRGQSVEMLGRAKAFLESLTMEGGNCGLRMNGFNASESHAIRYLLDVDSVNAKMNAGQFAYQVLNDQLLSTLETLDVIGRAYSIKCFETSEIKEKCRGLEAALEKYGEHDEMCETQLEGEYACTCGLIQIIASFPASDEVENPATSVHQELPLHPFRCGCSDCHPENCECSICLQEILKTKAVTLTEPSK